MKKAVFKYKRPSNKQLVQMVYPDAVGHRTESGAYRIYAYSGPRRNRLLATHTSATKAWHMAAMRLSLKVTECRYGWLVTRDIHQLAALSVKTSVSFRIQFRSKGEEKWHLNRPGPQATLEEAMETAATAKFLRHPNLEYRIVRTTVVATETEHCVVL